MTHTIKRWLQQVSVLVITLSLVTAPLYYPLVATAEGDLPPDTTPPDCATILAADPAPLDIPETCWEQVTTDEPWCGQLFDPAVTTDERAAPMRDYFAVSCEPYLAPPDEQQGNDDVANPPPDACGDDCSSDDIIWIPIEQETEATNESQNDAVTGNNTVTEQEKDVNLDTGDATTQTDTANQDNTNVIEHDPAPADEPTTEPSNAEGQPTTKNDNADPDDRCLPEEGCQTAGFDVTQETTLSNEITDTADTGQNVADENEDDASITTGDARAVSNVVNVVNTNVTSGGTAEIMIDVADSLTGNINLLDIILQLLTSGSTTLHGRTSQNGSITNLISLLANSGGNSASRNGDDATIVTGNAVAAVNLVNVLNTTLEGSNILFSFVNIMGDWVGDLIVPGIGVLPSSSTTEPQVIRSEQTATVTNQIELLAETGANDASGNEDDGSRILTGDALALASIYNSLNMVVMDDNLLLILPNIFGEWDGSVVNNPTGELGYGTALGILSDGTTTLNSSTLQQASIMNMVRLQAITGQNSAVDNGDTGRITTGNAAAAANIINIANTHLIGSNWSFAFLNLFGNWKGNIVFAYPDLAISNDAGDQATPGVVMAGEDVTYTLHYRNNGLAPARQVVIRDAFPADAQFVSASHGGTVANGIISWDIGNVPAESDPRAVSFTVRVPDNAVSPGEEKALANTVAIHSPTNELDKTNNISGSTLMVRSAATLDTPLDRVPPVALLTLTKTNSATGPLLPGQEVEYTITATAGSVDIHGVTLHDTLYAADGDVPFEKTWNFQTIEANSTVRISYALTIPSDASAGTYSNSVVATSANAPTTSATSNVTVAVPANSLTQKPNVNSSPTPPADSPTGTPQLSVSKRHHAAATVVAGSDVSYVVTIANTGTAPLHQVTADDVLTLDANSATVSTNQWDFGTMRPGERITISYDVSFAGRAPIGRYSNTARATGLSADGTRLDAHATSTVTLTYPAGTIITNDRPTLVAGASWLDDVTPGGPRLIPAADALSVEAGETRASSYLAWWLLLGLLLVIVGINYLPFRHRPMKRRVVIRRFRH